MAAPLWGRWARPLSFRAQVHVNRQRTRESFETAVSIFRRRRCPRFCLSLYSLSLSLSIYLPISLFVHNDRICLHVLRKPIVCPFTHLSFLQHVILFKWSCLKKSEYIYIYIYIFLEYVCFVLSLPLFFSLFLSLVEFRRFKILRLFFFVHRFRPWRFFNCAKRFLR